MLKDETLNDIVEHGGNIAQFVSFGPDGSQRFMRIRGIDPSRPFASVEDAAATILKTGAPFVNIRSFLPEKPYGNPFFMGRRGCETPEKIGAKARELVSQGFHIILNEEIDVNDGGFSGVLLGNVAEFATRDTPRCVEKPGCAVLPRLKTLELARIICDHRINIPYDRRWRVEFSVHPAPVGYGRQHQIVWQVECTERGQTPEPLPFWPNLISCDMGDKVYGILIAHLHGFRVPYTKCYSRVLNPFEFGEHTGSPEPCWRRTCPREQQPGLYTTKHGMVDPWTLMQREDPRCMKPEEHQDADGTLRKEEFEQCDHPRHRMLASIIFEDDVETTHSGAAKTGADGNVIIEGKFGRGDTFMGGTSGPAELPDHVVDGVKNIWEKACDLFGPVRFEWCYDKTGTAWVVQLHVGQSKSIGNIIYPGEPDRFEIFDAKLGLEALRPLAKRAKAKGFGIILRGDVGVTSHFGDILSREEVPSRLERV